MTNLKISRLNFYEDSNIYHTSSVWTVFLQSTPISYIQVHDVPVSLQQRFMEFMPDLTQFLVDQKSKSIKTVNWGDLFLAIVQSFLRKLAE